MKPEGAVRLRARIVGVTVARDACARHHRHLPQCAWGWVGLEVIRLDTLWPVGWGIIGRPASRLLNDDGWVQFSRGIVPDDAPPSVASCLLGAAARWAKEQGKPIVTYTLQHEPGVSMRAAGWVCVGRTATPKTGWQTRKRAPTVPGFRWRWVPAWCLSHALARGWEVTDMAPVELSP